MELNQNNLLFTIAGTALLALRVTVRSRAYACWSNTMTWSGRTTE